MRTSTSSRTHLQEKACLYIILKRVRGVALAAHANWYKDENQSDDGELLRTGQSLEA